MAGRGGDSRRASSAEEAAVASYPELIEAAGGVAWMTEDSVF
jgi:hypothetical protein